MTTQEELFHDSLYDAIGSACRVIGKKKVATTLWPGLKADSAIARLANTLRDDKDEKFCLSEVMWIMAEARKLGDHSVMRYLGQELSYAVTPVDPEIHTEDLRRDIRDELSEISKKLDRLERVEQRMKAVS